MDQRPQVSDEPAEARIKALLEADDPAALELIWDCWAADIHAYLLARLRSRPDAEDVMQEVFVRMARKREQLARARNLRPYVFSLTRNVVRTFCRQRQRHATLEAWGELWPVSGGESDEEGQSKEELGQALARLPEKQRLVIVLKTAAGKTFQEIAEVLGISENTAASRYRYGVEKLRQLMRSETA
jgi:RNA polymerase sigma-70 factor, ECF subfamily